MGMDSSIPEKPLRVWTSSQEQRADWILRGQVNYTFRGAEDCHDLQVGDFVEAVFRPGRYGMALTLEIKAIKRLSDGNFRVHFCPVEDEVRRPTPPPKPKRGPVVFVPRSEMRPRPRR